jgi:protein-S-isoprenylcysteine O-methyltransferase Ste14
MLLRAMLVALSLPGISSLALFIVSANGGGGDNLLGATFACQIGRFFLPFLSPADPIPAPGGPRPCLDVFSPGNPPSSSFWVPVVFNIVLIQLWGSLHTFLAQEKGRSLLRACVFGRDDAVRATFTLIASLTLCLALALWQPVTLHTGEGTTAVAWSLLGRDPGPAGALIPVLISVAWIFLVVSTIAPHDPLAFFGVTYRAESSTKVRAATSKRERGASKSWQTDTASGVLNTTGVYSIVRHPMYFFSFLVLVANVEVALSSVVMAVGMAIYLLAFGLRFEEAKLVREFGPAYERFQQTTAAILPPYF